MLTEAGDTFHQKDQEIKELQTLITEYEDKLKQQVRTQCIERGCHRGRVVGRVGRGTFKISSLDVNINTKNGSGPKSLRVERG